MAPRRCLTWFEPVSAAKAVRGLGILPGLDFISPNMDELTAIAAELCPQLRLAPLQTSHAQHMSGPSPGGPAPGTAAPDSSGETAAHLAVASVGWALSAVLQVCWSSHQAPGCCHMDCA